VTVIPSAARFVTAMKQYGCESDDKLVFFSGDLFSPSSYSRIFEGEQMIGVLNELNVKASCLGNHDTDFGLDEMN